jgi:ribosomal protein S18 acetylase RimI-like enzyme
MTCHESTGVRPFEDGDLDQVVRVHMESFPGYFLSFLGRGFLRLLYASIRRDPEGVMFVAMAGGRVVGIVAAVEHQAGFYRRLLLRKWAFAITTLAAVLKKPIIAPRLLRALDKPAEANKAAAEACILSLAVSPRFRENGAGEKLVRAACGELAARGAATVCLSTDGEDNDRVNLFYQRLGFLISRTYVTPEGRVMNEYLFRLRRREFREFPS